MSRQFCEAYKGWHIWFEPDGGYVIGQSWYAAHELEGYYGTRDEARKDIDWHVSQPVNPDDLPPDSPCLPEPWWHHR